MGMQLETIGDFMNDATDDEKYKILHILFDAVYYDFGQRRPVGFKPQSDFVPIFRLAAPLSGWTETEGLFLEQLFEILTGQSGGCHTAANLASKKLKLMMAIEISSTEN